MRTIERHDDDSDSVDIYDWPHHYIAPASPLEAAIRYGHSADGPAPAADAPPVEAAQSHSALAVPQFRLLFIGNVVTMMGFSMMQVVQGVLAFDLTGKNGSVGFVAMAMGIPMLLLGPFGGALSDRMSKRMLLMFGQAAITAVFFSVGLLTVLDRITISMLAGLTLLLGCTFATLMPARQAWVGELLEGPALSHGVALQQLAMNATRIIGPIAAAAMIALAFIDVGGTYMVMASFFLISFLILFIMQPTHSRNGARTSILGDLGDGLRYTWNTTDVRLSMLMFAGVVLSAFSYQQLMPGFLENELGQDAKRVGVMFGVTAVGGIIVTLFLTRSIAGTDAIRVMFICGAALAGSLVLLAAAPTFPMALGASALVGATSSGFQMCNQVYLMQRTNPAYFGRVMSLTMTAFGMQLVVGFPVGALADVTDERVTLTLLAAICLVVVAMGYLASRGRRRVTEYA